MGPAQPISSAPTIFYNFCTPYSSSCPLFVQLETTLICSLKFNLIDDNIGYLKDEVYMVVFKHAGFRFHPHFMI